MADISCETSMVYAFKIEQGRPWYLLLRLADGLPGAGRWCALEAFPREHEPSSRAAVRWLLQETSLEPVALWSMDRVETEFDARADLLRLRTVYVALVAGEVRPGPAWDAARWLSDREAATAIGSDEGRQSLEAIHRVLGAPTARGQETDPRLRIV